MEVGRWLLDRSLACCGWLACRVDRRFGRRVWAIPVLAIALLLLSGIPTGLIAASPYPTHLTFEEIRDRENPPLTTWVRVVGDVQPREGGVDTYTLSDPADASLYLILEAEAPLPTGFTMVTGRLAVPDSPAQPGNNIGTMVPDVPAVPETLQPWPLILLPAATAVALLVGARIGYPAIRQDRARHRAADARPAGAGRNGASRVQWSGRLAGRSVPRDQMLPAAVSVNDRGSIVEMILADEAGESHVIPYRRGSPSARPVRVCRVTKSEPALDVRTPSADLLLVLRSEADRELLASALR